MKKTRIKLATLLMCGALTMVNGASVAASVNKLDSVELYYTVNAPTSANKTSDSLEITPIKLTYKGRYGWQCFVKLDSFTSTVSGTYVSGTVVNTSNYHNASGAVMIGAPLGMCETTTNAPSDVRANVRLEGNYGSGYTYAVLSSCNDFT